MANTRKATRGISEEMRDMNIGDIVQFPLDTYNYNSVRSTPSTSLVPERAEGKMWRTRVNYEEKCTEVIRVS